MTTSTPSKYREGKAHEEWEGMYSVNIFKGDEEIIATAYGSTEREARRRAQVIKQESEAHQL